MKPHLLLAVLLLSTGWLAAQAEKPPAADDAWAAVEQACRLPEPPREWMKQKPANEDFAKFFKLKKEAALTAADKARDFYRRYPDHVMAAEARKREFDLVSMLVRTGDTAQASRLDELEKVRLADPATGEDERFEILSQALMRKATAKRSDGLPAMLETYEQGIRELQKQFPKRTEIFDMLLDVANQSEGTKAIALAEELAAGSASDEVKKTATGMLRRLKAVGKPLALKFTALDGHEVDVAAFKGKVVLVDFWATWCPECIEALPKVKALYQKYHDKNFEVVGISLNEDRNTLQSFLGKEKMAWPQFFDGKGWDGKFCVEYQIEKLPAMWLVDKAGILRHLDADDGLAEKVEKLIGEK